MLNFGFVNQKNFSLLTDLYELTMAQIYFDKGINDVAVFEFFVRDTENRNYFLNAGLEQVLYYISNIRFEKEEIEYLRTTGKFSDEFLKYLKDFKFTGNLYAMEEGEIFFPYEPVVVVEAPLIQAQILETFIINTMQISILIATKALRCYSVAKDKLLVEFGLRRAHGTDAGMKAARNSFIGGFAGTSNVLAGKEFNIPIFGTMAHSFIMAHNSEKEAFLNFAFKYKENTIFLVDTYDTIQGVKNAVEVAKYLNLKTFKGIRLDSGDIITLSKEARKILDENGYKDATIFVSGSMNEYKIKEFLDNNAPIDGFGVGTELVVSSDLPYLDCAYKLVEYAKKPKIKLSPQKITLPAKKQVYRIIKEGIIQKDIITLFDEKLEEANPLLKPFIINGELVEKNYPSLNQIKEKSLNNFKTLPEELKDIYKKYEFLPEISKSLKDIMEKLKKEVS
ncbi:nicotinate phosphoribosyltransferase [Venenivibrio stagnispumantis]|uniref:Nicotinate phosphoribosyltransferase n=1 Tax=Venenivibrio stagnispumantis TaxID=407998 RepID=A0AA45WK20_9AQUI|nr:nicotinate phosphoribosyltransferase [Venenivibrio stagnispumantis]MCW4572986.1 nicotinate phosphoribosyltransferase [Venenivibrio stagnispumantis]SMP05625.1 nicotinate phosphoribosyltransferase [Venenivibrio stagnispumantis]